MEIYVVQIRSVSYSVAITMSACRQRTVAQAVMHCCRLLAAVFFTMTSSLLRIYHVAVGHKWNVLRCTKLNILFFI